MQSISKSVGISTLVLAAIYATPPTLAEIQVVALSGDTVPTSRGSAKVEFVGSHSLNNNGDVAFTASWTDAVSEEIRQGVWRRDGNGALVSILESGDQAYGLSPEIRFSGATIQGLADDGQVLVFGQIVGPGLVNNPSGTCGFPLDSDRGLWQVGADGGTLIARHSDIAPGIYEHPIKCVLRDNVMNAEGDIVVSAQIYPGRGVVTPTGLFRFGSSEGLTPIVVPGEHITEFDSFNAPYLNRSSSMIGFNDQGSVALMMSGSPRGTLPDVLAIVDSDMRRTILAVEGNTPLNAKEGITMTDFGPGDLNNADQVALHVGLAGTGIVEHGQVPRPVFGSQPEPPTQNPAGNGLAIAIFEKTQQPQTAVRSGDFAQGIDGENVVYYSFGELMEPFDFAATVTHRDHPIRLNDRGQLLFYATLNTLELDEHFGPGNDEGLWLFNESEGERMILREGDLAPGTSERFNLDQTPASFELNEAGQTVVSTFAGDHQGIWATDRRNELQLIAISGQSIDLAPGDSREVQFLSDEEINSLGQVSFHARFTDGSSGVFVSNLVAVPEPASSNVLMATAGLLIVLASRTPSPANDHH